jgi:hypothetical protein
MIFFHFSNVSIRSEMPTSFNQLLRDAFSLSKAVNGPGRRYRSKDLKGSAAAEDDADCNSPRAYEETDEDYQLAVEKFRQRVESAAENIEPRERARGFDYVLWRPSKRPRLHTVTAFVIVS